jgi:hypothetical protein
MVPAFYTTGDYSDEHETNAEKRKREKQEASDAAGRDIVANSMARHPSTDGSFDSSMDATSEVELGEGSGSKKGKKKAPLKL